jgi:hypothetical protein
MRLTIAALILLASLAEAGSVKAECKNRCDSNYQMCVGRANTKQAKKSCKVDRKLCKSHCR